MKFNIKKFVGECRFELIASAILLTMYAALVVWVLAFRVENLEPLPQSGNLRLKAHHDGFYS